MRLNRTTFILLCTSLLFGKSYTIDNVKIESTIGGDGIVQITEKRTFNFRGDLVMHIKKLIKNYLRKYMISNYQKMVTSI